MASFSPKKARAKLLMMDDGIEIEELIGDINGSSKAVRRFLAKLFVEEDQRPTAERIRHDKWLM